MSTINNWFSVADDGLHMIYVERAPIASDGAQNGIYNSAILETVVTQAAVAGTDQFQKGWRIDVNGALRVLLVNGGAPADSLKNNGFLTSVSGQLCVTTDPLDHYIEGVPVSVFAAVCVVGGGGPPPGTFTFGFGFSPEAPLILWNASSGAITYEIWRDGVLVHSEPAAGSTFQWLDDTITVGGTFSYTMNAINASGTTQSSSNPQIIVFQTVPAIPAAPVAAAGNGNATITFVPPADGGSPITQYQIQVYVGASPGATQTTSASPYIFTGLTNGVAVSFKIAAANGVGQSAFSTNSNIVTPVSGGAVAIFTTPLLTTMVPTVAGGSNVPTFVRSTVATTTDYLGNVRGINSGEVRFRGTRSIRNTCNPSQGAFNTLWIATNCTIGIGVLDPLGGTTAGTITATAAAATFLRSMTALETTRGLFSCWIRRRTGTGTISIRTWTLGDVNITSQVTSTWQRFTPGLETGTLFGVDPGFVLATSGDAIDIDFCQAENIGVGAPGTPGNYVSRENTDVPPFHGAGSVDLQYFSTTNANTITTNVVNEIAGVAIATTTVLGYSSESSATNICIRGTDHGNAAWVKTNVTTVTNSTLAPTGDNTAETVTATAALGTILQTITVSALNYVFSVFLKRLTGVGVIEITTDGVTWTAVTGLINTVTWTRVSVPVQLLVAGSTQVGMRITTNTDAVYAWGAQLEQGNFITSVILTTSVALTRIGDLLSYVTAGNLTAPAGTAYFEHQYLSSTFAAGGPYRLLFNTSNAGGDPGLATPTGTGIPQMFEGTSTVIFTPTYAINTQYKSAAKWAQAGTTNMSVGGAMRTAGAFNAFTLGTSFYIGNGGGGTPGTTGIAGCIRNFSLYNVALSDSEMNTLTA